MVNNGNLFISLTLGILVFLSINKASAQNSHPTAPPQQTIPFILPPQLPETLPIPQSPPPTPLDIPPPSLPSPQNIPEVPGSIIVTRFEFEGNTAFNDDQLGSVTAPFTNKAIAFSQLLQAETAINQLYTNAGYINSGAVIPAGQVFSPQGAVVKIQVIEGSIEDIRVRVEGRLFPDYIQSRLEKGTQTPLNRYRLLEALQLLQLNPLIQTISSELSDGSRPNLSILTVKVIEADTFNLEAFMDNNRIPSVGSTRRGLRLNQGNLWGWGDRLFLEYVNTKGSNGVNLRYTVPINADNGTIGMTGGLSQTTVIQPPFDRFDLDGDSTYLDVTLRQPLWQTPTQELAIGVTSSYQENQNRVLGVGTSISPGAEPSGRTKVSAIRLFQEWSQRSAEDVLSLRSQFNVGADFLDPTFSDMKPDNDFFAWRGQGQYVRLLAPDTLLILRTDLQLASNPLLPIEQFRIGGRDTVRGYQQDLVLTDNGFLASLELRVPLLRIDEVDGLLQIAPFFDYGAGWDNRGRIVLGDRTLAGYGIGLRWQMGTDFTARFDWGIPLTETGARTNEVQTNGVYFSIDYRFF